MSDTNVESENVVVKLKRAGQADIVATFTEQQITNSHSTEIKCTVDLTGKQVGLWDIEISATGMPTLVQPNAFEIQNP